MLRLPRSAVILLLSLVAMWVTEESVSARTWYVSKRGNDRNPGTSARRAFRTLSRAFRQRLTYGDTVYIGAGRYTSSMSVRAFASTRPRRRRTSRHFRPLLNRPLRIVADTTGRFTGSRGPVVVAVANRWAATVANTANVQFEGLTFGPPKVGGRYYGVYANGSAASVTAINCTFRNVYFGALISRGRMAASRCTFTGNVYGAYGARAAGCFLQDCRFSKASSFAAALHAKAAVVRRCSFDSSKYGLYVRGIDRGSRVALSGVSVSDCIYGLYGRRARIALAGDQVQFRGCTYDIYLNRCDSEIAGLSIANGRRPLTLVYGTATIRDLTLQECSSHGLYTANMEKLELTGGRFSQAGGWAVHAHGRNLSVTDSRFDQTRYGLYVRELGQITSPTLRRLSFADCTYGLRCNNSLVAIPAGNELKFSDCTYAVMLVDCRSQLQGLDLTGGQRPLNLYRGTASIDGLSIRQSKSIGVYSSTMDQLSITNGDFGATGSWAVLAHGKNLSVSKSKFTGSRYGLHVRETTGQQSPRLNDLTFSDCAVTGMQVSSSAINLSANSNIRVDNCRYGIYLANCTSQLSGLRLSSSKIPLYVNGGTCDLDGVTIENATSYGLLAYRVLGFTGKNLTCTGAKSWGFYGNGQSLSLSDSTISSCGHGVLLDGQGASKSIPLANVEISDNTGYGLYVRNGSFEVSPNSTLKIVNNRRAGLYVTGTDIELAGDSGIELTGNGIGLYANRTNVKLSGFAMAGNGVGVLQYYGNLKCRKSLITGGRHGIYQVHSPECELENTRINDTSSWGLRFNNSLAKGQRITLKNCSVQKCGGGISATMLADGAIDVSESAVMDNNRHGIYSRRGKSTLSKTTIVGNRGYGVIHYDGPLDVTDSTITDSQRYGVLAYGYQNPDASRLMARRNRVTGNSGGIFAYRVAAAELVNNVSAGNVAYGVAVNVSGNGEAKIWNNSIVDNRYGIWHQDGAASIQNNIIANGDMKAARSNAYGIYRSGGKVEVGHNLLFGQQRMYINTSPGTGDVIKPPRFVNHAKGDYRLAAGSPAINAGTSIEGLTAVDIQGLSRPTFGAFEMGAFEYPGKSGSIRILDWREKPAPSRPTTLKGL